MRFYGEHTIMNFLLSFLTWIESKIIQLQENWPTINLLSKAKFKIDWIWKKKMFSDVFTAIVVIQGST